MKLRSILVGMMLVLALGLFACGIPKDKYNAVLSERDRTQTQLTALQSDLDAAVARVTSLTSDLNKARTDLSETESQKAALETRISNLESQVSSAKAGYSHLQDRLAKAKPYADVLEKYFFVPTFEMTTSQILDMSSMVDKTGDENLKQLWATCLDTLSEEDYAAFLMVLWDGVYGSFQGGSDSTGAIRSLERVRFYDFGEENDIETNLAFPALRDQAVR